jgi:hypothetical protein
MLVYVADSARSLAVWGLTLWSVGSNIHPDDMPLLFALGTHAACVSFFRSAVQPVQAQMVPQAVTRATCKYLAVACHSR